MNGQQRTGQRYFHNQNNVRGGNVRRNFNRPVGQQVIVTGPGGKGNRDAVIRKNLAHMKQVAQKKRVAQEIYYGNTRSPMIKTSGPYGRSPMVKTSLPYVKQEPKFSVQNRLSVQARLGQRGPQNFVKNNITSNKKPIFINVRPNTNKLITGMRSDKIVRVQHMTQQKRRFNNNRNGLVKTVNSAGKVVFLQPARKPNNYTVRVNNERKHHVQKVLNPVLQQEIKLIQNKNSRQIVAPVAPLQPVQNITNLYDDRLPMVSTARTLHERFSSI